MVISQKCIKTFVIILILCVCSSCTNSDTIDLERASESFEKGYFRIATSFYEKVRDRDPHSLHSVEGAKQAANLALHELKDFERAIKNYKHLVLYSQSPTERLNAQKAIARIYFDNLTNYSRAIIEYNKLLQLTRDSFEEAEYKIAIARAYYHLGQFFQAQSETEEILRKSIRSDQRYEMLVLKGNIRLALKDYKGAAIIYTQVFDEFPERSKKEELIFSLVLAYEEMGEYQKAIESLNAILDWYKPRDFVEIRISKIENRLKNQPKERLKK